ncbi:MAG: AraC family transcriptional regulator [Bacteroidota bacterium]
MPGPIEIYQLPDYPKHLPADQQLLLLIVAGTGQFAYGKQKTCLRTWTLLRYSGPSTFNILGNIKGTLIAFEHNDHLKPGHLVTSIDLVMATKIRVLIKLLACENDIFIRRSYLQLVLQHSAVAFHDHAANSITQQLISLIDQHYRTHKNSTYYARQLGYSSRVLNGVTRNATGKIVQELIKERILAEAERLLSQTDMRIKEIAYELNFTDQTHFAKFFRRYHQISPGDFRARHGTNAVSTSSVSWQVH